MGRDASVGLYNSTLSSLHDRIFFLLAFFIQMSLNILSGKLLRTKVNETLLGKVIFSILYNAIYIKCCMMS